MVSAVIVEEENALFVCVCTGENAGLSCDSERLEMTTNQMLKYDPKDL